MTIKICSLFFFFLMTFTALSQVNSPFENLTVQFDELEFDNVKEEEWFSNVNQNTNVDSLEIFYSINNSVSNEITNQFKFKVSTLCESYKGLNVENKKFEKELKKCFNRVHKDFLVQYVEGADFNDLVGRGLYNCLSGTVLYAMILDRLNIPYEIKEGYFHIYMIVSPGIHNITLESTMPSDGVYYLSKAERQRFIDMLVENKLIAAEDYELSEHQILSKYSNTDPSISLKKLVSHQYYNNGIRSIQEMDFVNASKAFTKASFLSHDLLTKSMLAASLLGQFPDKQFDREKNLNAIIRLFNYGDTTLKDDFRKVAENFFYDCMESNNYEELEIVSNEFIERLDHESYRDLIKCKHAYTLSYFQSNMGKYDEAIKNIMYSYNCDTVGRINTLLLVDEMIIKKLLQNEDFLETKAQLEDLFEKYPAILESETIKKMYLGVTLYIAGDYFRIDRYDEGMEYLEMFREKSELWEIHKLKDEGIGYGYGEAAAYFIRKESYSKAKKLIEEGLEYNQFDYTLNHKKDLLKASGY